MVDPYKYNALLKELQNCYRGSPVRPALRIGNGKFITLEAAHRDITTKKIRFLSWWLSGKRVKIRKSTTSESIYFSYNGFRFRISDHKPFSMDGIDHSVTVKFDSCVIQIIHHIYISSLKIDNYEG
jgi:hypothetical protein